MEQTVSNGQKKTFFRWILDRHLLANREIIWLLHYLMSNDKLLGVIHIVDEVARVNRSITIACADDDRPIFRYVKTTVETNDPEKAFHDLRMNQEEDVYLELDIEMVRRSPIYFSVLEENPNNIVDVHEKYGTMADYATVEAERNFIADRLNKAINEALDHGDQDQFYLLSKQLNQLRRQQK
ncbi:YpiB family protein [Sporolactobacillus shoreicorticis]|uniref:YpiB family protein n=1 Tax=Sporolactobacillus shoreicorticis TaxID=1923877 RepID=A0ABW5S0J1_9BACL|nr:YpiB family protein [Sporolactobacillus shoreicorticis]MCO7127025.1 YpiB family protein [Sporolactobacillus shoreicorticis]